MRGRGLPWVVSRPVPTPDAAPEPPGVSAAPSTAPPGARSIWWTGRAIGLHVTLVIVVPAFLALFWWQVQRVREGNTLSWAYVFEWPFFTGYAVYLWWKLVHDQLQPGANVPGPDAGDGVAGGEDAVDEELAAYNRYLAELHTSGRRKRW